MFFEFVKLFENTYAFKKYVGHQVTIVGFGRDPNESREPSIYYMIIPYYIQFGEAKTKSVLKACTSCCMIL